MCFAKKNKSAREIARVNTFQWWWAVSEVHAGGAPVHVGPGAPKRRGSARSSGANCKCAEDHSVAVRIGLASLDA